MEPRRVNGKNHWYHETQSTICPVDVLPLVPEAAHVEDRFLLDLTLPAAWLRAHADWLHPARQLAELLFPDQVAVSRLQTFTAYDRLSTALTVAQVYGVQRLCNHYAARLAPLPGPDSSRESNRRLAQITQYARQLAGSPSVINALSRSQLDEVGLTSRDIILFNQIIGFVGFQARAIAVLQAAQGFPVRWIPVCPSKRRHPRSCSPRRREHGRQTLRIPTCSMPMMSVSGASPAGSRCPVWASWRRCWPATHSYSRLWRS